MGASLGGDTDTVAALAGALVGGSPRRRAARERHSIPKPRILDEVIKGNGLNRSGSCRQPAAGGEVRHSGEEAHRKRLRRKWTRTENGPVNETRLQGVLVARGRGWSSRPSMETRRPVFFSFRSGAFPFPLSFFLPESLSPRVRGERYPARPCWSLRGLGPPYSSPCFRLPSSTPSERKRSTLIFDIAGSALPFLIYAVSGSFRLRHDPERFSPIRAR